ncbi:MAG: hypothetical protein ACTSVR_04700 [Candidatus Thorarchaeota archaeon]
MADIGMVYDLVKETRNAVSEIKDDLKNGAVKMENHNVRLGHIEADVKDLKTGQKKIKTDLWEHINSKKKHYNQGYTETIPQKVARKKVEITIITILTTLIGWLVNNYFGG